MSTRLVGCSVDSGINRDVRELTRTPQVIQKKKITMIFNINNEDTVKIFRPVLARSYATDEHVHHLFT
jgi:hypothetical protein